MLDTVALEAAIANIVNDRLQLARGFLEAAEVLAKGRKDIVRRSAVSRAYYAAYQAARALHLSVQRADEDDHKRLGSYVGSIEKLSKYSDDLNDLRRLRDEFDYSPYPGPNPRALYSAKEIEAIIKQSVVRARRLMRVFQKHVKERG